VTSAGDIPAAAASLSGGDAVHMQGIVRRFPGVLALDHVDFGLKRGEIHALLGENGAGKSTLMKVLCGLVRPDSGQVCLDGAPVTLRSPRDAIAHGVGMVHQHFMLVPSLTVTENVILGLPRPRVMLDLEAAAARIAGLATRVGLTLDPGARVADLSVGECQRVEILKVLYRGARTLLLDEPTAVLAPAEVGDLFDSLRRMAADGAAVVIISHKLDEVLAVADRCTVLHRGRRTAGGRSTEGRSAREIAAWMMGRESDGVDGPDEDAAEASPTHEPGDAVLSLDDVRADRDDGTEGLSGITLEVRAGEVVGVAGVSGNGQTELAEVIAGLRRARSGRMRIGDADVTHLGAAARLDQGLAFVPEDRSGMGSAAALDLVDNVALRAHRRPPVGRGPWFSRVRAREAAQRCAEEYGVVHSSVDQLAGQLSGGNLQKLILGRELDTRPRVLVAAQPPRGLDLAAAADVARRIRDQRAGGTAVLLVSEDLDELERLADRVVVLYGGAVVGEQTAATFDRACLGRWMTGAR